MILIGQTKRMKLPLTANATPPVHRYFGRLIPRPRLRVIAIQALCMAIVLFDFLGAVMGLRDFVITCWNHHPLLTIVGMATALVFFASLVEFGIASLRPDLHQIIE